VEPTVVLQQLSSTFFDTALLMVVKERSANASYPDLSRGDSQQKAMSDFYMVYNLIVKLVPILPALLLARLGDRGWRRAPIVVSLSGYLVARVGLLLLLLFRLPLEVMFGLVVVFELGGGYCAFWSGVMTLTSIGTAAEERSKVIMGVELLYGMAGLVGSLVSGHLYPLLSSSLGSGTLLVAASILLHVLSLLQAAVLLKVRASAVTARAPRILDLFDVVKKSPTEVPEEGSRLLPPTSHDAPARSNKVNVLLLLLAAMFYDAAVSGAVDILGVFVVKEPLSWSAAQVGYGNAAGCMIFLTSFLGLLLFRRCMNDVALILLGMISFATGIFFMTFVTTTTTFYLVRSLNLFALIPMPTIRSLLSKQVPSSSCGEFCALTLALKFAGLAYIPAFTQLYQRTLDWFPGLVFMLSSVLTVVGMIPVSLASPSRPAGGEGAMSDWQKG
uniref:Solute carrier family 46 member 2 n=1 Tax=Tetraodon nigroviridis TaxID=99883 RepID=H3D6R0_TETNG